VAWRRITSTTGITSIAERIRQLLQSLGFVPAGGVGPPVPGAAARIHDRLEAAMDLARLAGDDLLPPIDPAGQIAEPICLGLFGEFSAGKSSLANLLICSDMLPTSVLSSTRVPTRLRHAADPAIRACLDDGEPHHLTTEAAKGLDRDDVEAIEIGLPNDLLRYVELLDTPGFSDPYHDPERTYAATEKVDIGIWCTLATQAWRYSEQQIWTSLPEHLRGTGILIVTHKDTLPTQRDRTKVMARLERETAGLFNRIVMISVPDAIRARANDGRIIDLNLWRESGGEALLDGLLDSLKLAMAKRKTTLQGQTVGPVGLTSDPVERITEMLAEESDDDMLDADEEDIAGRLDKATKAFGEPTPLPPEPQAVEEEEETEEDQEAEEEQEQEEADQWEEEAPPPPTAPEASSAPEPPAEPAPPAAAAPADVEPLDQILSQAQAALDACYLAASVDLEDSGRSRLRMADDLPPHAERVVGAFVADLFQGSKVKAIERLFKSQRGEDQDGRPYMRELMIRGDTLSYFAMRSQTRPHQACLLVTDSRVNLGLALSRLRITMKALDALD
jgi:hypothetical protein